jgi:cell filamentation protein
MSDEYEYSYDWDVRYCYENSNVLRNKLGIIDADALHTAEREIAAVRVLEAERTPIRGKLDFKHLCDIHRYIFGDIYEWAGNLRAVNIAKGNPFCNCEVLDVYGAELFGSLKAESYLLGTPQERMPERLAHYLSEINVLHPFREGNGRAQRLFIGYLALAAGYCVDFTDVTAAEMIEASVKAFDRDEAPMCAIFKRITMPISRDAQQTAVRAITGARSEIARLMRTIL